MLPHAGRIQQLGEMGAGRPIVCILPCRQILLRSQRCVLRHICRCSQLIGRGASSASSVSCCLMPALPSPLSPLLPPAVSPRGPSVDTCLMDILLEVLTEAVRHSSLEFGRGGDGFWAGNIHLGANSTQMAPQAMTLEGT